MEPYLKRRVLGAFVTVLVVAITLPVLLDRTRHLESLPSNVPPMPDIPEWAMAKNEAQIRQELTELVTGEAEKALLPRDPVVVEQDQASIPALADTDVGIDAQMQPYAWVLQVGAFKDVKNANLLRDQLRSKGYKAFTDQFPQEGLLRVYVGPELKRATIGTLQAKLRKELKQDDIHIKRWQLNR